MIPDHLRCSVVPPISKTRKLPLSAASFRPTSLTSFVGKLIERIVYRRSNWFLEHHVALPSELSGLRRERSTADAMSDLARDLADAITDEDTGYVVFLCVCCANDLLPHNAILDQLQALGVSGQIYNCVEYFPRDPWFVVETCGITSTQRKVTLGVP